MICPRCGQPVSYIERQRRGNQVYYYAVHYEGYERGPDGRVHKKVRRCYLGPNAYIEVSKLHADLGLTLKGLIEEGRERDYMEALVRSVRDRIRGGRLTAGEARDLATALSRFSEELKELARELSEYASGAAPRGAVNETVAKAQAVEAPQVTTQAQTTEARPGEGEAYRTVSMLVGLTPEEVERQVRELQEALREFKRAQTTR
jgi:Sec-independent protein translocase protein TatA